jgi:hypothetical protein
VGLALPRPAPRRPPRFAHPGRGALNLKGTEPAVTPPHCPGHNQG